MEVREVIVKPGETLSTLKHELQFLNKGNYRSQTNWGARLYFEDSEVCRRSPFYSCRSSRCALMRFVPERYRSEAIPCRYIPLNASGQTLEKLYRIATRTEEMEESVRTWLLSAISGIECAQSEEERAA